jgi:hypothetical protein
LVQFLLNGGVLNEKLEGVKAVHLPHESGIRMVSS